MAWISPLEFNMTISRNIYEGKSNNCLIGTAQKIATYSIIPLALVVFFEAIVKNMIVFNLANLGIVVVNAIHNVFVPEKRAEQPVEDPPAPVVAPNQDPIPTPVQEIADVVPPPPIQTQSAKCRTQNSIGKVAKIGVMILGTCLIGYGIYAAWPLRLLVIS